MQLTVEGGTADTANEWLTQHNNCNRPLNLKTAEQYARDQAAGKWYEKPLELSDIHSFRERLLGWSSYAVEMRYEIDVYPKKDEIQQALKNAKDLRLTLLKLLQPGA
jgi:hypothetical protein